MTNPEAATTPVTRKKKKRVSRPTQESKRSSGGFDLVTGDWTWDGGEVVDGVITSGNTQYKKYFGVMGSSETGLTVFNGYGDSNNNGVYDSGDKLVGTATLNPIATSPVYSGTFDADKSTGRANGYGIGGLLATAEGVGFWFA